MSKTPVYRHVVVFKFKETTTEQQAQAIIDGFANLPRHIDAIIGYEHGVNVSTEGLDLGYDHVFFVTFKDRSGFTDEYLPHPVHKAFVEMLLPLVETPYVVDYYVAE